MLVKQFCGRALLFFVFLSAPIFGATEEGSTLAATNHGEPWLLENVEMKPSSLINWGRLENGLRYGIMSHASPPGRVSLRLQVNAGSLHENDDERGYAHFVEHMAFNGTKRFPAGELVRFLERQGAVFGSHINASTSHTRTIYKLDLPDATTETLKTGLRVFRDFADGILFDRGEVKREKGVILSEARSRNTVEQARNLAAMEFLYAGTRVADRDPLGLVSVIENASSASLRGFYDAWYRPEFMGLAVVGPVDAGQVEALIRTEFASLAGRGAGRPALSIGTLKAKMEPVVASHAVPMNGFNLRLIQVTHRPRLPFTWGTQLEGMRLHSAFEMLARRLEKLGHVASPIIHDSTASADVNYGDFRTLTVYAACSVSIWEKALALAEQEIRRVIEHGFGEDELVYQQTLLRNGVRASTHGLATVSSVETADRIAESFEDDSPFRFRGESAENASLMIDRLTTEECQRAFRQYWGEGPPHIFITTAPKFIPSPEKVRAAYAASQHIPVEAPSSVAATVFGYDDFGPPGEVTDKKHVSDLDLWLVRLANNVRLNIKRTPFENNLARISIRIGSGGLSEPSDKPGLRLWAGAWYWGGLGKHTAEEMGRILNGLDSTSTHTDDDAFVLSGFSATENLPLALKELTAFIIDPAFRPAGHDSMAANLHGQLEPLWNQPEGAIQRFVLPFLAGNNPRIGVPTPEVIFARTAEELKSWMLPQLDHGPIEIGVVGDIDVEAIIAEVAKTFGALPVRQPKPTFEAERKLRDPKRPKSFSYYYNGSADRPSTLEFFWPVRDLLTAAERRQLPMLATIIESRVSELVREKKRGDLLTERRIYYQ